MERRRLVGIGIAVRFHHNKKETQKNSQKMRIGASSTKKNSWIVRHMLAVNATSMHFFRATIITFLV